MWGEVGRRAGSRRGAPTGDSLAAAEHPSASYVAVVVGGWEAGTHLHPPTLTFHIPRLLPPPHSRHAASCP